MTNTDDRRRAHLIAAAAFGLAVLLGLLSDGVHHDDDLTHFLMARWVWRFPEYLLNFWARPGFTAPTAVVAWIGSAPVAWHFCRLLSSCVTLGATLLAIRVAERLAVRPLWLVALACVLQPMATLLSYTTLVENFASLYIIGGVALLLAGRLTTASLVFSLAFVTRYDTLVLLPLWWLALWARQRGPVHRQPRTIDRLAATAVSVWAPLLHQLLLILVLHAEPWKLLANPGGSSQYTPAGPLVFIPQVLIAIPPIILALAIIGGARLVAAGRPLVPALAGVFLLTHILLRARGLYASGGFARFLVTIAPLTAICATAGFASPVARGFQPRHRRSFWLALAVILGIGALAVRSETRRGAIPLLDGRPYTVLITVTLSLAALAMLAGLVPAERIRRKLADVAAVMLTLGLVVQFVAIVRPLRLRENPRTVLAIHCWLDQKGLGNRPVFSAMPWTAYFRDFAESPRVRKSQRLLASMPVGTIVIWDDIYCPSDYHRLPRSVLAENLGYRALSAWDRGGDSPRPVGVGSMKQQKLEWTGPAITVFEKIAVTRVPATEPAAYPPDIHKPSEPTGSYYVPMRQ